MTSGIRQALGNVLTKALGLVRSYPTRLTDEPDVRSLIRSLRPYSTEASLIRLGPDSDGGYLVPDDLRGIEACFSPGVAFASGFEMDCAQLGMMVFMADGSVDKPSLSHQLFHFTKKFVGATTSETFITMDQWVETSLPNSTSELLLQIDIESGEYEAFLSTSDALMRRFRIIVVEFHQLDKLFSKPFFDIANSAFRKILQSHSCVHIHPNNCCGSVKVQGLHVPRVVEITFLRTDRVRGSSPAREFPNPLDRDNTGLAPLPLPPVWFDQK